MKSSGTHVLLHHQVLDSLHDELGASVHHSGKQAAPGGGGGGEEEREGGSREWGEIRTKKEGTGGDQG